jgi:hypothetical protein
MKVTKEMRDDLDRELSRYPVKIYRSYKCLLCNLIFDTPNEIIKHLKEDHA